MRADDLEPRLSVVFQPIVHLRSGAVHGYEALGRGPAAPDVMLAAAARDGYLPSLDFLWRAAAVKAIAAHGPRDHERFFLNLDTRVIDDPHFRPADTAALLAAHGLSPERFVIELSERGVGLNDGRVASLSAHYREQGFRIALDDVGAGWSSLNTIVHARPNVLKLDIKLARGVATDPLRRDIVHALVDVSRRSAMMLIAEGIERREDLETLALAGVEWGQGWLLGRPQPLPSHAVEPLRAKRVPSLREPRSFEDAG
jgi:EAL domain-containing protein (putative c-di-GMP-specific phosphodiesterase class I)